MGANCCGQEKILDSHENAPDSVHKEPIKVIDNFSKRSDFPHPSIAKLSKDDEEYVLTCQKKLIHKTC